MVTFALGAAIVAILIPISGTLTILFPAILLIIAWLLITINDD